MKAVLKRQDIPGLVISAIIGVSLTFLGTVKLKNAVESKGWPVINGTVTSSEIAGATRFYPLVNYTYSVDGVGFNSDRISNMNFRTKKKSDAEDVVKKYPAGAVVEVHYNSKNPSQSFLEPGINPGHFLLLLFGLIVLAVPVISVILLKPESKKITEQ